MEFYLGMAMVFYIFLIFPLGFWVSDYVQARERRHLRGGEVHVRKLARELILVIIAFVFLPPLWPIVLPLLIGWFLFRSTKNILSDAFGRETDGRS